MRPLLLDLFCGAGGAAAGYARAGFDVVGVDIVAQPHYPFRFVLGDALEVGEEILAHSPVAAIHASPPCQRHSMMSACRPGLANRYPDLISSTRALSGKTGLPYVIENVPGSPLKAPVMLCGMMFGRELYRHRLFESNIELAVPPHPEHMVPASRAGHWVPGTIMSVSGHIAPISKAREVMGIGWTTREELAEAIPPAYTEYVGRQLMSYLDIDTT